MITIVKSAKDDILEVKFSVYVKGPIRYEQIAAISASQYIQDVKIVAATQQHKSIKNSSDYA